VKVPFVDLKAQNQPIQAKLDQAIRHVVESCDFILGDEVARFEEEYATYCGTRYAVGLDSGLSAMDLSLRAFRIGEGDEVIIPAHTFIATAAAVTFVGAQPVLVEVDPSTYNIDIEHIEAAITPRTRAIMPVHLYGLPAEMDAIMKIAKAHDLIVIEDACQAHGALYKGKRVGSLGHAGAFSFYPEKNLGGFGDGGMIVTDDVHVAEQIRAMRNYGQVEKYCHELTPFNHRLDTLQAAILRVKLHHLDRWNEARRQAAAWYKQLLVNSGVVTPVEDEISTHVYHLYVVRTYHRDALQSYLREQGIGTAIHYPIPIHLQPYYAEDNFDRGLFPTTEEICDEVLSLPMFPTITLEQVQYVAEHVNKFAIGVPEMEGAEGSGS
jgi:dTDP-4-amino-4,6-dideoxygalactose transaminase